MGDLAVVVVAAGRGSRAGGDTPKQYQTLAGKPVLRWSLERFNARADVARVVVAIAPEHQAAFEAAAQGLAKVEAVWGGASRTASVRAGLEALAKAEPPARVLIHDAARPFADDALVDRVLAALAASPAAAPALRPADALKRAVPGGGLGEDIDRDAIAAVQTPQGFHFAPLLGAYRALAADADLPDDIAVAVSAGLRAAWADGDPGNFKLTLPGDLARAEALLVKPAASAAQPSAPAPAARYATGLGVDAHRLVPGDGLTLCGVRIAGAVTLSGHSDADVALHAVTDALLGAIGAGDIGDHFPPSDPQWKGADSKRFLGHAVGLAAQAGAEVVHADLTIICERPKVKPHRAAMRQALAQCLGVDAARASVKATTTEGMGFTGRGEGVAAQAVVTVLWR